MGFVFVPGEKEYLKLNRRSNVCFQRFQFVLWCPELFKSFWYFLFSVGPFQNHRDSQELDVPNTNKHDIFRACTSTQQQKGLLPPGSLWFNRIWESALCISSNRLQVHYTSIIKIETARRCLLAGRPNSEYFSYPDSSFGEACPHCNLLSHCHVWVSIPGEHCFQFLQLVGCEVCPLSSLLALLLEIIGSFWGVLCGKIQTSVRTSPVVGPWAGPRLKVFEENDWAPRFAIEQGIARSVTF